MRRYLAALGVAVLFLLQSGVEVQAHPAGDPSPGRITADDIAHTHEHHGHEQFRQGDGDPGHRWSDYRREARQLRNYLAAVARAQAAEKLRNCSADPRCAVRLAAFMVGAPYRLMHGIVTCESGYNPAADNPSSTAGGLLQYLESTWQGVAPIYGMSGRSRYEVWPAAWVGANHLRNGGPSPWAASQGCWG